MSIQLEQIIPLGRRFSEYELMFELNNINNKTKIIDCGSGPSSFNFEASQRNLQVTSIDPIYQFSAKQISTQIDNTFKDMMKQVSNNRVKFVWSNFSNVEEVENHRKSAMQLFIDDYEKGKTENRYIHNQLPVLQFNDNEFDLALCSHFLFLYSENLSFEFHVESIIEMLRVASEVRIFPVVDLNSNESPYLSRIIDFFKLNGYSPKLQKVDYEFQKNANKMLVIR